MTEEKKQSKTNKVEVDVTKIQAGARYANDLFDSFGNLILKAHSAIEEGLINHLISSDVTHLYYDPTTNEVAEEDKNISGLDTGKQVISDEFRQEIVSHTKDLFENIRQVYASQGSIAKVTIDSSRGMVDKMLDAIEENSDGVHETISKFKDLDEYHHLHSTNVSIISSILATRLEFKKEIRAAMGVGGLFHDIGMSSISKDIVNKVEQLSEEEFDVLHGHPHVGYKLVENNKHMHDLEKQIVLMHHEKADGSGYPFGFDMDHLQTQTPKEVRLLSLCDVFSALVGRRPPNPPLTARQALRAMLNMVHAPYKKTYGFIPADFRDFIRALGYIVNKGAYFIGRGDLVRLNNGDIAIIEEMNKLFPLNPKIRVVKNAKMENLKRPIPIDLLKDYKSYIANVFDRSKNADTKSASIQKINDKSL